MTAINTLGNICTACSTLRKQRTVLYDGLTLLPYCNNPFICNEKHPNSSTNLITRGSEYQLLTYTEATQAYNAHLISATTPEMFESIKQMLTKPTLFRVLEPDLAEFLVMLHDELKHDNMSTTIRHIIRAMKDKSDIDLTTDVKIKKRQEVADELRLSKEREDRDNARTTIQNNLSSVPRHDADADRIRI